MTFTSATLVIQFKFPVTNYKYCTLIEELTTNILLVTTESLESDYFIQHYVISNSLFLVRSAKIVTNEKNNATSKRSRKLHPETGS